MVQDQLNKCKVYLFLGRAPHENIIQILPIFLLNLLNLFLLLFRRVFLGKSFIQRGNHSSREKI